MSKINRLILEWPKGTVKSSRELNEADYSSQILKVYANTGWISLLDRGAYKLADDTVGWQGGLYSLQKRPGNQVHVGAKTALELKGFAHYIAQQPVKVDLFGKGSDMLPAWFTKQTWMKNLRLYKTDVLRFNLPGVLTIVSIDSIPVKCSAPELAILEMLLLVPQVYSFVEASLLLESLTTLRSDMVQSLLENSTSIKANRLFLYLAEKHGHHWFNELNLTMINLGSGKREIVKNGKLNKKYGITVPVDYEE